MSGCTVQWTSLQVGNGQRSTKRAGNTGQSQNFWRNKRPDSHWMFTDGRRADRWLFFNFMGLKSGFIFTHEAAIRGGDLHCQVICVLWCLLPTRAGGRMHLVTLSEREERRERAGVSGEWEVDTLGACWCSLAYIWGEKHKYTCMIRQSDSLCCKQNLRWKSIWRESRTNVHRWSDLMF